MKNLIDTISFPKDVLLHPDKYNISNEELLVLLKLVATDKCEVDFLNFLKSTATPKTIISQMVSKKLIDIKELQGKVIIDLMPFYKGMLTTKPNVKNNEKVGLSAEQIDKISHIFGKKMFPAEIEQINQWVKQGHSFEQIENAIYSALSRGINNLNYIEKIVVNNKEEKETSNTHTIKRNWNF